MSLEAIKTVAKKTIGTKQTMKAVEKGQARLVFIAADAEEQVVQPLLALCQAHHVPVEQAPSMQELGQACGIEVGAAAAAILAG